MSEKIVQLNEEVIKGQLKELVRGSIEETLQRVAGGRGGRKLTQAARYERNEQRQGYRSGHYSRNLTTTSGGCHSQGAETQGDLLLRPPLLNGTAAGRAAWKRCSLRCIWRAYPSGVWRTSPRPCGAVRSLPPPSVS